MIMLDIDTVLIYLLIIATLAHVILMYRKIFVFNERFYRWSTLWVDSGILVMLVISIILEVIAN